MSDAGLVLPPDVIQPIFLRFRRDDRHVMAVIEGHPAYEAVEAMIQDRPGGGHSIRAIITRHDSTQVDHVNDEALAAEMRGADRAVVASDIALELGTLAGGRRRARLGFRSMAGEAVGLDVVTIGPPDTRGSGLTDPGGHAASISLPLMWRGASTLAGEGTHVLVDGARFDARPRTLPGPPGAREGYYSEPHLMGVIRAGTQRMTLRARPGALEPGQAWVFAAGGGDIVWRIEGRDAAGVLRIARSDGAESVLARPARDGLAPIEVSRYGGPGAPLTLRFEPGGRFAIALADAGELLAGAASMDGGLLRLAPERPAWAAARPVRATCGRA